MEPRRRAPPPGDNLPDVGLRAIGHPVARSPTPTGLAHLNLCIRTERTRNMATNKNAPAAAPRRPLSTQAEPKPVEEDAAPDANRDDGQDAAEASESGNTAEAADSPTDWRAE